MDMLLEKTDDLILFSSLLVDFLSLGIAFTHDIFYFNV